jgi:hypothetical protein
MRNLCLIVFSLILACLPVIAAPPTATPAEWSAPEWSPDYAHLRTLHIDGDGGNDANPGTIDRPLATSDEAFRRIDWRSGSRILFKRGAAVRGRGVGGCLDAACTGFSIYKGGLSADQPLVIGAYGDGPAPVVREGIAVMGLDGEISNLIVRDFDIVADRNFAPGQFDRGGTGVFYYGFGDNVTFENLKVSGFAGGFNVQSPSTVRRWTGVTIRGCVVVDSAAAVSWKPDGTVNGKTHSSGLFASGGDGLRIVWSVFQRNGWRLNDPARVRTIFNHNLYLAANLTGVEVSNTITADGSATNIQARANDVQVIGCLSIGGALGITSGHEQDMREPTDPNLRYPARAFRGAFLWNQIVGASDLGENPRGYGLVIGFADGAVYRGNAIGYDESRIGGQPGVSVENPSRSFVFENNVVAGSNGPALAIGQYREPYGSSVSRFVPITLNELCVFQNNTFVQTQRGSLLSFSSENPGGRWVGNRWGTGRARLYQSLFDRWTETQVCPPFDLRNSVPALVTCGAWPDVRDLLDYVDVLAGAPCHTGECGPIDFNGDGVFPDDADQTALYATLIEDAPALSADFNGDGIARTPAGPLPDWSVDAYARTMNLTRAEWLAKAAAQRRENFDVLFTARGYRRFVGGLLPVLEIPN